MRKAGMNMIGKELCPAVKRARDFKLYTYDGRVLLDLYRENGRAFSGHKSGKLVLTLKNAAEQGVFCSYPSVYGGRLQKALRTLFPAFPYSAVFSGESAAMQAADALFDKKTALCDPVRGESGSFERWRPTLPVSSKAQTLFVILPAGGFSRAVALCSRTPLSAGETLSAVETAVLTRAVYDWIALSEKIADEAPKIAAPAWKRNGFYLLYGGSDYDKMRTEALNRGVLLPPTAVEAAVLPLTATKGDWGKITEVLTLSEGEY